MMLLSRYFTLDDLTVTNQSLTQPNTTDYPPYIDNLKILAEGLDVLWDSVGPFQILSGFRTQELQAKLKEGGNPTSVKLSFHEVGRGVDIYPTTMPLEEYFGLILSYPDIKNNWAEISIKPSQGSIHLAVNVPGDWRTPKIMGLTTDKQYASLSLDDIQRYIAEAGAYVSESFDEIIDKPKIPVMLFAGAAVLGLAAILLMPRGRSA